MLDNKIIEEPVNRPLLFEFRNNMTKTAAFVMIGVILSAVLFIIVGAILLAIVFGEKGKPKEVKQPVSLAKRVKYESTWYDTVYTDYYRWLRNDTSSVRQYLEVENDFSHKELVDENKKLIRELLHEFRERRNVSDEIPPFRMGNYMYTERTNPGMRYKSYYRTKINSRSISPEEDLFDLNSFLQTDVIRLGNYVVSPDESKVALSIDEDGSDVYSIVLIDLQRRENTTLLTSVSPDFEWFDDSHLYYVALESSGRQSTLMSINIDTLQTQTIYHEQDQYVDLRLDKTSSEEFLLLYLTSLTSTEIRFVPVNQNQEFQELVMGEPNEEYQVDHREGYFYIRSNKNCPEFCLFKIPETNVSFSNAETIIGGDENLYIGRVQTFRHFTVVNTREKGVPSILILSKEDEVVRVLTFDGNGYTIHSEQNRYYDSKVYRFSVSSFISPRKWYEFNLDEFRLAAISEQAVAHFDPENYDTQRLFAISSDNTQIPVSLIFHKSLKRDGSSPCYLRVFGAHGTSMDPEFDPSLISLLDRNYLVAIAHVRGGGEFGAWWHAQGKAERKKSSISDLESAVNLLIEGGWTSAGRIALSSTGTGGVLVGNEINRNPSNYAAVSIHNGVLDPLSSLLEPATQADFRLRNELGNPTSKKAIFDYIRSYAAYDNTFREDNDLKKYPRVLVTASINHRRVMYWESARFVAGLRYYYRKEKERGEALVFLVTQDERHNRIVSSDLDLMDELTFEAMNYAFIISSVRAAQD